MSIVAKIALCVAITMSTSSTVLAWTSAPTESYGTPAEQQQCVANMEASLHGQSPLGSRDTSAYIQDRGNLDSMGMTEYDVLVGRCMDRIYHHHMHIRGGPR